MSDGPPPPLNEISIVYQATVDSLGRTRNALILLSTVICIGYFHLYEWYASWDLARISARTGILSVLRGEIDDPACCPGPYLGDQILRARLQAEVEDLTKKRGDASFSV